MAGIKLPANDLEGKPMIFDSFDMSPVLFGTGPDPRETWCYFTENELLPGALRYHNYKFVFNLRGDNGQPTGGLAVDTNLGWKGAGEVCRDRPADLRPLGRSAGTLRPVHE